MRAALVTPLSGPLAEFGRAGAAALRLWARSAGRVELSVHDSAPGVSQALADALDERPDLLFGPYGTGQATALARKTDRLVWNHGGAGDRLSNHAHVVNVLSPCSSYFTGAVELLHREIASLTVLHGETTFGREVAAGAERAATGRGLTVRRAGFAPGSAEEAVRNAPEAGAVMIAAGFADERAAARLLPERPWRACVLVGAGEENVLDEAREGLIGPTQWLADEAWEPDEGPDAGWFVRNYVAATGADPPYPAAQAFAAGVIASRCARDVGDLDDDALRAAASALTCTTMFGRFELDASGAQVGHQMLTVQWQDGRRRTVWPPERARGRRVRALRGHLHVPHTADLRIEAWAPTREGCVTEAVSGLVGSFADTTDVRPQRTDVLNVPPQPDPDLLVAVLDDVIYRLEVHGELVLDAEITTAPDGGLTAGLKLGDATKVTAIGAIPKAVSLHELRLTRDPMTDAWSCAVTIDV
ncbi:SHS2 domain-containing protein [Actinomadura pelletieri DSM 43383]|uniref:SHS2 domain-containing protein n=1 Tax=Actinomadura pelletieri DSM 43383 TaxID=1120940 RepID=A0A495QA94_9ACTN|nr:archease [Actinomadura pelletieri]RKS68403.1 SHS2 domain-containing protein [Actinomadura pelletieri DSM 43383]